MRVRSSRPTLLLASVGAVILLGSALVACGPTAAPTATPKPTHATSTPSASPTPVVPELIEGGTAEQNHAFFDKVNNDQIVTGSVSGVAFVEALVAAGFAREDIEVTPDNTNVTTADSIMFSVRLGDSCLVGQYGKAVGYASTATTVLATGTCLVGTPRPAA